MGEFTLKPSISFVVPVFDEAPTLEPLFAQIQDVMQPLKRGNFEVIFIDDGSRDDSWQKISELVRRFPSRVRAARLRRNFGKAQALSVGFHLAVGEVIITMDADLQDDPREIPQFLAKLDEGFDLVSGWKYERHDPLSKTIPSKLFNQVARWLSGIPLHDFNCGYKAYRQDVLKAIRVYGELHRYIPILADHEGFRIAEIKVHHNPRTFGKSKYGWKRYVRGFLDLLTVTATTRYLQRPGHLFGGIGVTFGLIGFSILTYLTIVWFMGHRIGTRPLLAFGIMLSIIAVQFISLGLIAELLVRNADARLEKSLIVEKTGW